MNLKQENEKLRAVINTVKQYLGSIIYDLTKGQYDMIKLQENLEKEINRVERSFKDAT